MNKMKLTVMICVVLFGLQIVLPMQSPGQAKQNNNHFVTNAITTNVGTDTSAFLTSWDTSLVSTGSSNDNQIRLPLIIFGKYNFIVQWGDGAQSTITSYNQAEVTHTYTNPGVYNLNITGLLNGWAFVGSGDVLKIIEIAQWGNILLGDSIGYFQGASNLKLTATDAPNLTNTAILNDTFYGCTNLGNSGNMNSWNVSKITSMTAMFENAKTFDQPLGNWNVSQVTDMNLMFFGDIDFNQPIGNWDVSHVTNMHGLFEMDYKFNQPLINWNVSNVNNMGDMFYGDAAFNQPIGNWDVSHVIDMGWMFSSDTSFNQPLTDWNVSKVTYMHALFYDASAFNQPIGNWDVSHVFDMGWMLSSAIKFNQTIMKWNVSLVKNMDYMFYYEKSFNQDLSGWNVSNLQSAKNMFFKCNLSISNYSNLLIGWSKLNLQRNVTFDGGSSEYNSTAVTARQSIITNFGWTITDGGQFTAPSAPSTNSSTPTSRPSTISPSKSSPVSLLGVILGLAIITGSRVKHHRRLK